MDIKMVKIGVCGGGVSSEREISLCSSNEAFKALKRQGCNAVFIDINTRDKDVLKSLFVSNDLDLVFLALHGEFGEDGQIQAILEELDLPYTGSGVQASRLAMDKIKSKEALAAAGILCAGHCLWQKNKGLSGQVRFPCVVKPCLGGSSIGISIVKQESQLAAAIEKASAFDERLLIEDFIEGREFTVGVFDEKVLPVIEIVPKSVYFDFDAKYSDGLVEFVVPADLPQETYKNIQAAALSTHQAIGCRHFSRIDIRLGKDNIPYVLELNAIPGLTTHSLLPLAAKANGISFDQLILGMAKMALNKVRV